MYWVVVFDPCKLANDRGYRRSSGTERIRSATEWLQIERMSLCEAAVRKNAEVSCSICYGNPECFQAVKVGSQLSPGGHNLACFNIAQVGRMDIHTYRNISASVIDIYTFTLT